MVAVALLGVLGVAGQARGASFAKLVGPVKVGAVKARGTYDLPFILWGGEAATMLANGNALSTQGGSVFAELGLKFKLVPGDDFVGQVRRYLKGETPFLRGTFRMIGMASEVLNADPRTRPVVVTQMTWSRGDHAVARAKLRTVADLKGKTIVLQQGGPHVGMLDDMLQTAKLSWDDVRVVWVDDITGPKGPAARFKKDPKVDVAFVVTPDMLGLVGGLDKTGTGAEGTVKGAHVLVSTAELTRSIADVYVVRKDFYDAHRDLVAKFAAGYLKGAEQVVALQKSKRDPQYRGLLAFMVKTYGKDVLPNASEADGLIADCAFVGHGGNVAFFTDPRNQNGFANMVDSALRLATTRGYAAKRTAILAPEWKWEGAPFSGTLSRMGEQAGSRFNAEATLAELEELSAGGAIGDRTIYSFTISFEPNQTDFSEARYSREYQEAIRLAGKYGGAALVIRGHADPAKTLGEMVKAGIEAGVLQRRGSKGNYHYYVKGRELKLGSTKAVVDAIQRGLFDRARSHKPREVMQAARTLSQERANIVRDSILAFAAGKGLRLDASQVQAMGVGIREPIVPVPRSLNDVKQNTRVEFALVRVSAEATTPSDFDY